MRAPGEPLAFSASMRAADPANPSCTKNPGKLRAALGVAAKCRGNDGQGRTSTYVRKECVKMLRFDYGNANPFAHGSIYPCLMKQFPPTYITFSPFPLIPLFPCLAGRGATSCDTYYIGLLGMWERAHSTIVSPALPLDDAIRKDCGCAENRARARCLVEVDKGRDGDENKGQRRLVLGAVVGVAGPAGVGGGGAGGGWE
jgi:hypothetical protein